MTHLVFKEPADKELRALQLFGETIVMCGVTFGAFTVFTLSVWGALATLRWCGVL